MITNERSSFIGGHVTPEIKKQIQAKALEADMSVSEYLYHLCKKHIAIEELESSPVVEAPAE